jgi:hypothetical protein
MIAMPYGTITFQNFKIILIIMEVEELEFPGHEETPVLILSLKRLTV